MNLLVLLLISPIVREDVPIISMKSKSDFWLLTSHSFNSETGNHQHTIKVKANAIGRAHIRKIYS